MYHASYDSAKLLSPGCCHPGLVVLWVYNAVYIMKQFTMVDLDHISTPIQTNSTKTQVNANGGIEIVRSLPTSCHQINQSILV